MRLIDADALKKYIEDCRCCSNCKQRGFMCEDDCDMPDFLTSNWQRVIDEQDTVAPVKHGHWINAGGTRVRDDDVFLIYGQDFYKCSNCYELSYMEYINHYCKHCGAKMDEVSE